VSDTSCVNLASFLGAASTGWLTIGYLRLPTGDFSQPSVGTVSATDVVGKEWNPQILLNLPISNVSRCISCNVKTLRLHHLQFPNVGASSGPPD
jgi:hypothetical protein